jgi:ADP-L-glycero-D-manno-heptose 6-epimerase
MTKNTVIVTGAAGFIGSHIVEGLNKAGFDRVIAVDDLSYGHKFTNLVNCNIVDFVDKAEFLRMCQNKDHPVWSEVKAVFHQGACSDTTEWNGQYMLQENLRYSQAVLGVCLAHAIGFYYASSAAIYGKHEQAVVDAQFEQPLNVYGYSKLLFDQHVRRILPQAQSPVIGLRYFNVFGARETHKKHMKSVVSHFHQALIDHGEISIFTAPEVGPGEQARDFIYVKDVVAVNLWCMQNSMTNGIYNCGSGHALTFNQVAQGLIDHLGEGRIAYQPMPEKLRQAYQFFTQADMQPLRQAGYTQSFVRLADALQDYMPIAIKSSGVV